MSPSAWLLNVLVAFDQLINAILRGFPEETLSSRAYRMAVIHQPYWGWMQRAIDALFFWQDQHCRQSYEAQCARPSLPLALVAGYLAKPPRFSMTVRLLMWLTLSALLVVCVQLTGCGGGTSDTPNTSTTSTTSVNTDYVKPRLLKALLHPSDSIAPGAFSYDLHIQPRPEGDIAENVLAQSKLPGQVILWAGFTKGEGFEKFPEFLSQAVKYPNIRYAYVYDELDWGGTRYAPQLDRPAIYLAADQACAAGLKPIITISPDVVLQGDFAFDVKRFAVIGIDPYPSARPVGSAGFAALDVCRMSDNELSNLFGCSAAKLRRMGFEGKIFYVYQAFGIRGEAEASLLAGLKLQRDTIDNAAALGADGVMPYGLYLGAAELAAEPHLYPLAGTAFESLVKP